MSLSEREQSIIEELERQFNASQHTATPARSLGTSLLLAVAALVGLGVGALAAVTSTSMRDGVSIAGLLVTVVCVGVLGRAMAQLAGELRARWTRRAP